MAPDIRTSWSGSGPPGATLSRLLAAAPDWQSLCKTLAFTIPRLLPYTRLDIYAIEAEGVLALRFTSAAAPPADPPPAATDVKLRFLLQREGYSAIITVPLVGGGQQRGWLVLARQHGRLTSDDQSLVDQIAPLLALRLYYDQREAAAAASAARLEQRLAATAALRLRATLAAGAAHDIGNLFTTMMGYTQILQQDLPQTFQADLKMIIRALEDGRQLLRRLQASGPTPNSAPSTTTSAALVVREVVMLTRPLWERRAGVNVEIVTEGTPLVWMPAEDLREVLVNLVLNAVAALTERGTIVVYCRANGHHALIAVADTGQGIARELHSAIFQPLVTTRSDGGGIGLSVSRALVEGHGGTLTVDSAPGQGATFTIALPIARSGDE